MRPIAIILLLSLEPGAALAADVYLRPATDCGESGDGTTWDCAAGPGQAGAFTDWGAAQQALAAGDTLWLDGTFERDEALLFIAGGDEGFPIRITSVDPAAPARIVGALDSGLVYFEADDLEVDHLVFLNSLHNCLVVGQEGPDAIHYRLQLHHNQFDDCGTGISITYIEDVEIHDNVFEQISSLEAGNQDHCIYPAQGSRRVHVYRNRCTADPEATSTHCLQVYHDEPPGPAAEVDFHDNVCVGFTIGAGIYNGSTDIRIWGNTFLSRGSSFPGLRCDYGGSTAWFVNNIVTGDGGSMGALNVSGGCVVELHHNLYSDRAGEPRFTIDDQSVSLAEWQAAYDADTLVADPLLVSPEAGDVHLLPDSPARDRGDAAFAAETDHYGAPRVSGSVVDIGAAEYQEAGPDAGGAPDAGAPPPDMDAATELDGDASTSPGADAGPATTEGSGCGCRTVAGSAGGALLPIALLLGLLARRRA